MNAGKYLSTLKAQISPSDSLSVEGYMYQLLLQFMVKGASPEFQHLRDLANADGDIQATQYFDDILQRGARVAASGLQEYLYAVDGSVSTADLGKLMMDDGSSTAKVYQPQLGVAGNAQLVISAPSHVGSAGTQASFNIVFHSQPTSGDFFNLFGRNNGGSSANSNFTFSTAANSNDGFGDEVVHIGATLADTIANFLTVFAGSVIKHQNFATIATNGPSGVTITADATKLPGASGNVQAFGGSRGGLIPSLDVNVAPAWALGTSPPWINPSTALEITGPVQLVNIGGSNYLGPDNGVDTIVASNISLSDNSGTIFNLTAGVDWTPGHDAASEAAAIFAATASHIAVAGWTQSNTSGPTLTFQNPIVEADSISFSVSGGDTSWASPSSTNGTFNEALARPIGKLLAISGSTCLLCPPAGQSFICNSPVNQGDTLAGSVNGTVATSPNTNIDWITGVATTAADAQQPVLVAYSPNDATAWQSPLPTSIEAAIDRIARILASNVAQP